MKVCWEGFCATNYSWSIVAQNICRQLDLMGHEVDMYSTNGTQYFPDDLKHLLKAHTSENPSKEEVINADSKMQSNYDMQLTYTAFKNFEHYLARGNKNRFGIWTYEFAGKNSLPPGFAKAYKNCDLILPPSTFAKQIFMDSGIPENHMRVIPHGIDPEQIKNATPYPLKTKKNIKIFVNIAQVHRRKNLEGLLEMYGKAFTKKSDVCLVIKVHEKPVTMQFQLEFSHVYREFREQFSNHAEVEIIKDFVPNIYSLYKACDIIFSASHSEAFGMTALEGQATGLINIAPNYGGFLDFLNQDNALLIEGKEFFVPQSMVYWSYQPGSKAFMPSITSGVEKLRYALDNKDELKKKAEELAPSIIDKYSWKKVTQQILELAK